MNHGIVPGPMANMMTNAITPPMAIQDTIQCSSCDSNSPFSTIRNETHREVSATYRIVPRYHKLTCSPNDSTRMIVQTIIPIKPVSRRLLRPALSTIAIEYIVTRTFKTDMPTVAALAASRPNPAAPKIPVEKKITYEVKPSDVQGLNESSRCFGRNVNFTPLGDFISL